MDHAQLRTLMTDEVGMKLLTQQTIFLDEFYKSKIPVRQRLWHVETEKQDLVTCKICNQVGLKWSEKNKAYSSYCNSACSQKDPAVRLKTEQTCLSKFGKTTNLKTAETRDAIKKTNITKYGVDNFAKTQQFKDEFKTMSLEKYGVSNPSMSQEIKDRVDATHIAKYGKKRSSQLHIPDQIIELKNNKDEMYRLHHTCGLPISKISEMLGVNHSQLCIHFKTNLGIEINTTHMSSLGERELGSFLSQYTRIESNNRSIIPPKEIDIYIPEFKLAIEYNGIAWHSELRKKDRNYHLNKTNLCAERGIRLIHIFDSEWKNQNEIVKSRLLNILQRNQVIYARLCTIKKLENKEYIEFYNKTHIQGVVGSTHAYGLFYKDELIAVMSFGKSRFSKSHEWELLRYSSLLNINVVGGASRLFKHFIKDNNPTSIISYSDKRWNTGNLYAQLGFCKKKDSGPNYHYTKTYRVLESRMKYQKHKLAAILPSFDSSLTEWENMQVNGYDRIWDCGNSVWVWSSNT